MVSAISEEDIEYIFERAKHCCEHCGTKKSLEVHHIVTRGRAGKWIYLHDPVNLALLCRYCHRQVHDNGVGEYEQWLRRVPPNDCTSCRGEWATDKEERKIFCTDCKYVWGS